MEENNEELVVRNDDVPETSEEQVETSASESQEQVQVSNEDIDKQIEERANRLFEEKIESRLARDRAKREREFQKELSKYKQLENVIKTGVGVDNLDDAISKTTEFYTNQGYTIPQFKDSYSERDEKILANADAQEIIELGENEMEAEANRIASIPAEDRTLREKTIFNSLCKELISRRDVRELEGKGYKTEILDTKEFKDYKNQFKDDVSISKIYEMYVKENQKLEEKPASAGSAKNLSTQQKNKFSVEQINSMSPQEIMKYWNDPEFRKMAGLN